MEERQMRGASNVLRSLTRNSREVFRALAELISEADEGAGAAQCSPVQCSPAQSRPEQSSPV
eukprot:8109626-Pyramimonas_sp.AAC.1